MKPQGAFGRWLVAFAVGAALGLLAAPPGWAVPLSVTNPSFESTLANGVPATLLDGQYIHFTGAGNAGNTGWATPVTVPGWTGGSAAGLFNPSPGAMEVGVLGSNVAFANDTAQIITQQLADVLMPGSVYTLTARLGSQAGGDRYPLIRLLAGGNAIAQDAAPMWLGPGMHNLGWAQVSIPATHPNLGQPLSIQMSLSSGAAQVLFDDVRVETVLGRLVGITNAGFEDILSNGNPANLAENQFIHFTNNGNTGLPNTSIPGWTQVGAGYAGEFNPSSSEFPNGPLVGENILFINDGTPTYVQQTLGELLQPATMYTLSARLAFRGGVAPGYDVGLYAGGTLLDHITSATGPVLSNAAFVEFSFSSVSWDHPGQLGQPLEIRLSKLSGDQLVIDQVTLVAYSPEPATLSLLAIGGLSLLIRRRSRR